MVREFNACWLISERGTDARDNGYFFYKYLTENHKELDVRYIISKDSPDFDKIKKLGKYILYGSREHYIAFITSPVLISAHLMGFSPDMGLFCRLWQNGLLRLHGKSIMLKHGIIKDYLSFWNPNELDVIKNIKLFAEKDFMIDEKMRKKIEMFFSIRDKNNCKRIYEEIIILIDNNHWCDKWALYLCPFITKLCRISQKFDGLDEPP